MGWKGPYRTENHGITAWVCWKGLYGSHNHIVGLEGPYRSLNRGITAWVGWNGPYRSQNHGITARVGWRDPMDHRQRMHSTVALERPYRPQTHRIAARAARRDPTVPRTAASQRRCVGRDLKPPQSHPAQRCPQPPLRGSRWPRGAAAALYVGPPPVSPPTPPFPIRSAAVSSASARAEVGISPITTGKEKRQKLKSQNNRFRGTGNRRGAERCGRSRLRATGKQTARRRTAAGPGGPNRSAGQNRTGAAGRPSGRESRAAARVVLGAAANRSLCGPKAIEKPPEGPKPH